MSTLLMVAAFVMVFGGVLSLAVLVMVEDYSQRRARARVLTVILSEQNRAIIGDGAWSVTPAVRPRSARIRDLDPRGA